MEKLQEKGLLCDVFDAYFYDEKDNLVFMSENLTSSDISGSADETEVRNGRGNALFAKLYSNKTVEVTLQTNAFDFATVALLTGTSVATGRGTSYSEALMLKVVSNEITLPEAPINEDAVEMFIDGVKVDGEFAGKTVTLGSGEYEGKDVKVMPYEYNSEDDEMQEIVVRADQFPNTGKLVLKGVEKDTNTKNYKNLTIIIEKAQPSADFSFSTSSEVEPTTTEIKLSALSNNGKLMRIVRTPYEATP